MKLYCVRGRGRAIQRERRDGEALALHECLTCERMVKSQGQRRPEAKKAKPTSVAKRIRDVKRLLSKVRRSARVSGLVLGGGSV